MTATHHATVDAGRVRFLAPERWQTAVARLNGKRVEVTIRQHRERRSDQQSRYYWGVVVAILADHCGYTPEEMHDSLKLMFLRDRANEKPGLVRVRSTTALDTREFSEYVDSIKRFAASDLRVYIPDPGEVWI